MTTLDVTIEVPRGSHNTYQYDHTTGRIRLERTLLTEMVYPTDYGFIENTIGIDGDPLHALVLLDEPTFPGVGVTVRPIGVFKMSDEHGSDMKIITVPDTDPRWASLLDLEDVPTHTLDAIQHFFRHYKDLEPGKFVTVEGFGDRDEAERLVATAAAVFRSHDSFETYES